MKQTLKGDLISLRALEKEDLNFLYKIENNESYWSVSNTLSPFSKYTLKLYIENAHLDIYKTEQLRLIIEENKSKNQIGLIDLFDFDPKNKRAGIGILVDPSYQKKGYASESLKLIINYSFFYLDLHQLFANIAEDNGKSIKLFEKHLFVKSGVKKDWIFSNQSFKNEILFQLIKK